jgi:hypothetical protein
VGRTPWPDPQQAVRSLVLWITSDVKHILMLFGKIVPGFLIILHWKLRINNTSLNLHHKIIMALVQLNNLPTKSLTHRFSKKGGSWFCLMLQNVTSLGRCLFPIWKPQCQNSLNFSRKETKYSNSEEKIHTYQTILEQNLTRFHHRDSVIFEQLCASGTVANYWWNCNIINTHLLAVMAYWVYWVDVLWRLWKINEHIQEQTGLFAHIRNAWQLAKDENDSCKQSQMRRPLTLCIW